tara:strand:+ start:223 stop:1443 length:1221 start_codon:yes stop_codon:yes gene_type:complete
MKISDIKLRELNGAMEHKEPFWEERLVRPTDIYPEYRNMGGDKERISEGLYAMHSTFVEIHTDDGLIGLAGPCSILEAFIIDTHLRDILIGQDPLAIEHIWDLMYRHSIHGRKGENMLAISVVDCALWDIKGKALNQPVYKILGGPTRQLIPAYASALQFSVTPGDAHRKIQNLKSEGYKATKWFFRHGPGSGREGKIANIELVEALRDGGGQDMEIMMDAWSSWDIQYSLDIANSISKFNLKWLEEPVMADKPDSYIELQRNSPIPISGGEHEYTRWGFKYLVENRAMDYLQPDIYWAGGISETLKICALASTFDIPVIPHGHSAHATAHLIASQSPATCPLQEHLVKWNQVHQFFIKDPLTPEEGYINIEKLSAPGMGIEIDTNKIQSETYLSWTNAKNRSVYN